MTVISPATNAAMPSASTKGQLRRTSTVVTSMDGSGGVLLIVTSCLDDSDRT
jgi:hypothetical protein